MALALGHDELEKQAAIVDEQRRQEATRTDASSRFILDIQSSLLYSMNWSEFLSAAPMAISLMGACYVASTVPGATSITLSPPEGGFKHLSWRSLNANLIECSDMGRIAFTQAEVNLGNIALVSTNMFNIIKDIISTLGDRNAAKDLKFHMQSLRKGATRCQESITEVEESFNLWQAYVLELHQASVQEETNTENMILHNEIELEAKKSRLSGVTEARDMAKAAVERMGKALDTAEDAFKDAADKFPSGWEVIGMQFVSSVANTLSSTMGAGMLSSMGNTGSVLQAINIFSSAASGGRNVEATNKTEPSNRLQIPDVDDPAFTYVPMVLSSVRSLGALLSGKDGGVDWDSIVKPGSEDGFRFIKSLFEKAKGSLQASERPPSKKLNQVLDTTIEVMDEVSDTAAQLNELGTNPPDKSSEKVVRWNRLVNEAREALLELNGILQAVPGGASGQTPLVNAGQPVSSHGRSDSLVANYVESAKSNLELTLAGFTAAQSNYQKASDSLVDVQVALSGIMEELAVLQSNKISFTTIKNILIKCISTLSKLKAEITKLARFFLAIGQMIDHAMENQIVRFIDYVETATSDGPSIAGFTFTDLRRQTIFTFTMMIRAYLGMFRGIGLMYTSVSKEYIFPGLELCEQLSVEANASNSQQNVMDKKLRDLNSFMKDAQNGVKSTVKDNQQEIMGNLEEYAQEVAENLQMLSPIASSDRQAIASGTQVVTTTVHEQIDRDKGLLLRPFNDIGSLLIITEENTERDFFAVCSGFFSMAATVSPMKGDVFCCLIKKFYKK
ncbi:uncharacterized protein TRIREDRAFT_112146 [Trichoderma reesei QM6a]|uniref:Predicted protein n=1 Tax=Hypocrea jecorina (strain QM6a) TaxID=431241 RepID=G0RWB5_HYPJQ|nr:uncharacterized protein TRIREDRAFT_112146 [Trichoderma reesei QM6a]EGR44554.1 predicted protein [Trichoderma reesei QM6a]